MEQRELMPPSADGPPGRKMRRQQRPGAERAERQQNRSRLDVCSYIDIARTHGKKCVRQPGGDRTIPSAGTSPRRTDKT